MIKGQSDVFSRLVLMIYDRLMLFQSDLYDIFVGDYYNFPKVKTALVNSVMEMEPRKLNWKWNRYAKTPPKTEITGSYLQ